MLSGSKKHTEKRDLPIAAVFFSRTKKLKIHLLPVESKMGADGKRVRIRDSGLRVEFEVGKLVVRSEFVLKLLLKSRHFRSARHGFDIDKQDPTGFWRSVGAMKEKEITVLDMESVVGMPNVSKANLDKMTKLVKTMKDEDEAFKPLTVMK